MPRTTSNYIPRPDGDFSAWVTNYYDAVKDWWLAQGLKASDLLPLQQALLAWIAAYPAHVAAQQRADVEAAPGSTPMSTSPDPVQR